MKIRNLAAMLLTLSLSLVAVQYALAGGNPHDDKPPPTLICDLAPDDSHDKLHGCRSQLNSVFIALGDETSSIKGMDQSKLESKVCAADEKLHVTPSPKTDDAIQKLQDIIDTVFSKAKIDPLDAQLVYDEAVLAQACIGEL